MTPIDLRNATLDIIDGTTVSGTVANGYPIGTLMMVIDGITMAIPNGSTMTIAGQGTIYTVGSTVGTTTPTSVTFTPALTVAVADNEVLTFKITGLLVDDVAAGIGDTTVGVDGLSEAIQNGTTFKITGDTTTYTISSSVGGATPTSITFSPGLAGNTADDAVITLFRAGAVNHGSAAPVNTDTSFGVNGFSVALTAGMIFTIVGSTDSYEIVSSTGGATPTAIVFTPALRTAAGIPAAGAAITVHTNVLRVDLGEGNCTFEPKRNFEYIKNQRRIAFVRSGDEEPMDVGFDFLWTFLSSTTDGVPTIIEALTKTGEAANWVTSGAEPCEPYCVDLRITHTPPCTSEEREIITLPEYRWEGLPADLKAGTVSTKGKCKTLMPIYQRSA